jgi:hypothetical protein
MKSVELGRSDRRSRSQPESDNLFGWTVFLLLLCGFAVACWIGTFYVFSHPEKPFSYQLLTKLNKLDPPKRFELTVAPSGEFLTADKLLAKYGAMTPSQLDETSAGLIRSFLRNYDHQVGKVPYITGKFTILDTYPLSDTKYFTSGVVAVGQSVDVPTVYIEHLFPAAPDKLPSMQRTLVTGLGIELRRSYDLSAIINVENLGNGRLLFTCMPLLYGPYGTTQSGSGFQLDPPKGLNIKAGLPIVTQNQVRDGERRYAQYRRATGTDLAAAGAAKSNPGLVGPQPSLAAVTPPPTLIPVLKAEPVATPTAMAKGNPAQSANPPVVAKATAKPMPTVSPNVVATASPTPLLAAAATPSPTVAAPPLQPFLTASPTPGTSERVSVWQTYHPGQMPRGRLLDVDQTADLADKGLGADIVYLKGDFTVTAARENRAILRPRQSLADRVMNRGKARIIAEFPRGTNLPQEGQNFQRSSERPFSITDVRKGADGQINIYVREITTDN